MLRAQLEALLLSSRRLHSRGPVRLAALLFRPAAATRDKSAESAVGLLPQAHELGIVTEAQKLGHGTQPGGQQSTFELQAKQPQRPTTVTSSSTSITPSIMNSRSMTLATTALARQNSDSAELAQRMLAMGQSVALHSPTSSAVFSILVLLLVGIIDYVTGPDMSFGLFYLVPVSFAAWFAGKQMGTFVGALAGVVWLLADVASAPGLVHLGVALWNVASRTAVFIFVAYMLAHIRALHLGLEDTVSSRTRQLEAETGKRVAMEREIAAVSHREQQRIAHELHDGLGQELGGLAFQAKLLAAKLNNTSDPLAREAQRLVEVLNHSTARTRALSHLLDPIGEAPGALRHALSLLADRSGYAFGIACTFEAPDTLPLLAEETQLNLYRIAQEAIHNAVQHGEASNVVIHATADLHTLTLRIADDGHGFDAAAGNGQRPGLGLRIMRYRAACLRAQLEIDSAPGNGCRVVCAVPI